ncbi:MAG: heparinase II/III family protein, partial [Kineosporiaceae bacterium]
MGKVLTRNSAGKVNLIRNLTRKTTGRSWCLRCLRCRQRSQRRQRRPRSRLRRWHARIAPFVIVALVVGIKVVNYGSGGEIRPRILLDVGAHLVSFVENKYRNTPALHDCAPGLTQRVVDGGFVCTTVADDTVAHRIFNGYPALGGPRAAIYPSTTDPDQAAADALLDGVINVPRNPPYRVGADPDWAHLDPYQDAYWRFHYYSMRPAVALIDAYADTGDTRYLDRLRALTAAFLAESDPDSVKWADEHAVALRGMALVYQWWTLRAQHALTVAESDALLAEIARTADYLADPNHYDPESGHGTDESAALLLIAHSFPDLPGAAGWSDLARTRIAQGVAQRIDADGVLADSSPYYHVHELDRLWQIRGFCRDLGIPLVDDLDPVIDRMVTYATYILRPDRTIPLLGSSTAKEIHRSGSFQEMAEEYPALDYVLSGGTVGSEPDRTSITFPHSGHTVLRSGWDSGDSAADATYLTFNVGSYRNTRNHLDLLGVTLFGQGGPLLADGG